VTETATLAGGCFWGVEELLRKLDGVVDTNVGYAGGTTKNPRYEDVKTGRTGHAESLQVVFDPAKISYDAILDDFFRLHDPTTPNRQGNDIGTQYRSAIFYHDDEQREAAERAVPTRAAEVAAPDHHRDRAVHGVLEGRGLHQDYLQRYPNGYTCHFYR